MGRYEKYTETIRFLEKAPSPASARAYIRAFISDQQWYTAEDLRTFAKHLESAEKRYGDELVRKGFKPVIAIE